MQWSYAITQFTFYVASQVWHIYFLHRIVSCVKERVKCVKKKVYQVCSEGFHSIKTSVIIKIKKADYFYYIYIYILFLELKCCDLMSTIQTHVSNLAWRVGFALNPGFSSSSASQANFYHELKSREKQTSVLCYWSIVVNTLSD